MRRNAPRVLSAPAVGAVGVALALICWWLALGLPLAPSLRVVGTEADATVVADLEDGAVVVRAIRSSAGSHPLRPVDLIEEPDILPEWQEFYDFFERQSALTEILEGTNIELETAAGEWVGVEVVRRRPWSLPWPFYLQIFIGLFMWMVGVASYFHSERHDGARGFALSALGMGIVIFPAAVYSTRPLALDGELFRALSTIDHIGGVMFSTGILIMMIAYPIRLFRGSAWLWLFVPLCVVAEYWPFAPKKVSDFYAVMATHLVLLAITSVWQWSASRREPVARAAFRWTLISVLLGLVTFVVLIELPYWLGLPTVASQAVSLSAISLMFAGISLGIFKYRLFDLDRWWFRTWTWLIGGSLVVAADLLLVSVFGLGEREATMLALAVLGWLYFPARQWALRRFAYRAGTDDAAHTAVLLAARSSTELAARFEERLQELFAPLRITHEPDDIAEAALDEHGTSLRVRKVTEPGHYVCHLRDNGRRLYSPDDVHAAARLTGLAEAVHRALSARSQGAELERSRIRRDLHDDLGASIVRIIHATEDPEAQARAKEAMTDLRNVLVALAPKPVPVDVALRSLEGEVRKTLDLAGGELVWRVDGAGSWELSGRAHANLTRIVREATTNAIRHGQPRLDCELTVDDEGVSATLANPRDGAESGAGQGLANIAERIQELGGELEIDSDDTRFRLRLQLPREGAR